MTSVASTFAARSAPIQPSHIALAGVLVVGVIPK